MQKNDEIFLHVAVERGYLTTKQALSVMQVKKRITERKQRFDLPAYLYTNKIISEENLKQLKQIVRSLLKTKKIILKDEQNNLKQSVLQDRYTVKEEIGRGGMGVVYKAYDASLKRFVALKLLLNTFSEKEKQRFFLETESLAKLSHPNLVSLYNVYTTPYCFFVMELVNGCTFSKLISQSKLTILEGVSLLIKIAEAVHYIHQNKIIHRDIKPDNIMVTSAGEPKIMDFGVAKVESVGVSVTGDILGTAKYMSPEQASSKEIDSRSDIYSLGVILYEICTGSPPFEAENYLNTLLQVIEKDPIPPKSFTPEISDDLQTICLKCLEKDPNQRYGSAQEFANDLHCLLNNQPIKAKKASWRYKLRKFIVRNRLFSALSMLLIFFITIATFVYQSHQEALIRLELKKQNETEKALRKSQKAQIELKKTLKELEEEVQKLNEKQLISQKNTLLQKSTDEKVKQTKLETIHRRNQALNATKSTFRVIKKIYDDHEYLRNSKPFLSAMKTVFLELERLNILGNLIQSGNDSDGILALYASINGFNNRKAAIRTYSMLISKNGKPWMYFNRSNLLIDEGKYEEALKDLEHFKTLAPKEIHKYYILRGKMSHLLKKINEAENYFSLAIEKKPDSFLCYNERAIFYIRQKNYSLAERDYLKVIQLNPRNKYAYFLLNDVLKVQKKHEKAQSLLTQANAIYPNDFEILYQRGLSFLAQNKMPEAISDFAKVINLSPSAINAYYQRANIYTLQNKYTLAHKDLDIAISIDKNHAHLYWLKGVVYTREKNYKKATQIASLGLKTFPENIQLHLVIADSYKKQKKYKRAIYHLNKVIKSNGEPFIIKQAYLFKILAYFRMNKKRAAHECYKKLLDIDKGMAYFAKANIYALEDQMQPCMKYLKLAAENNSVHVTTLDIDPDYQKLMKNKRFRRFAQSLK
ncbi:protein kinase [Candidatus Uabimicrobium sp. HlEnr_7]|uniref:protein kinase domain-containing protein n=1 Tax=Candidatus Uabimicrobium helgolandensis TaxID=3095367 RepID=UPI0035576A9E